MLRVALSAPHPSNPEASALLLGVLALGGVAIAAGVGLLLWSQREPSRVPASSRGVNPRLEASVPAEEAPVADDPIAPPDAVQAGEAPVLAAPVPAIAPPTVALGRGSLPGRWGNPMAPVQIVVFDDFQCPYCARLEPTLVALHERYPTEVEVYFRDNPLDFHTEARGAHVAARCAHEQGRFWAMYERLFARPTDLAPETVRAHARALDLDLDRFEACQATGDAARAVDEDIAAARAGGVFGVPASFVNGREVKGAQPLSAFVEVVDEALAARR